MFGTYKPSQNWKIWVVDVCNNLFGDVWHPRISRGAEFVWSLSQHVRLKKFTGLIWLNERSGSLRIADFTDPLLQYYHILQIALLLYRLYVNRYGCGSKGLKGHRYCWRSPLNMLTSLQVVHGTEWSVLWPRVWKLCWSISTSNQMQLI